jgi:phosphoglycerol transferase
MAVIAILIIIFALAIFQLRGKNGKTSVRYLVPLLIIFFIFQSATYLAANYFTANGIDASVIYHLEYSLDGAGFFEYSGIIAVVAAILLAGLILAYNSFLVLAPNPEKALPNSRLHALVFILLLCCLFHPFSWNLLALSGLGKEGSARDLSFSQYYQQYSAPRTDGQRRPNLLFIYLESFEHTYFDPELFPNLTDNLKVLEQESLSFQNIAQVDSTNWTVAGLVASQCAIPLFTSSAGNNSMSGMDRFLPGATCLGDILDGQGYYLSYLGGASLEFAGKGKFLLTHGFSSVKGRDDLVQTLADQDYVSNWGIYDDSLLDAVYDEFNRLSRLERPFGLFALTMDTHHPDGHQSRWCGGKPYQDGENPILNAVHCSDALISRFIDKIRNSDFGKNTIIVIASDHLAMRNSASDQLQRGNRRNLFLVFQPERARRGISMKPGSTMDIAPTVLDIMGFDIPALGLGRSLLRSEDTLVAAHPDHNQLLQSWQPEIQNFWDIPLLENGLKIEAGQSLATIGSHEFRIPMLIQFDDKNDIANLMFEFDSVTNLIDYVEAASPETLLAWIDHCSRIRALSLEVDGAEYCIFAGKLGSDQILLERVGDTLQLTPSELEELAKGTVEPALAARRKKSLYVTIKYGVAGVEKYTVEAPWLTDSSNMVIQSAGGLGNSSYVSYRGAQQPLTRGIHLLGLNAQTAPEEVLHIDPCGSPLTHSKRGPLREAIDTVADRYQMFIIVSHDSALCPKADISRVLASLPLKDWKKIGLRTPYIALISSLKKSGIEFFGEKNYRIVLELGQHG